MLKTINETAAWLEKTTAEQAKKAAYDTAALTVRDVERRAKALEKEVTALLRKPKPKAPKKPTSSKDKDGAKDGKEGKDGKQGGKDEGKEG